MKNKKLFLLIIVWFTPTQILPQTTTVGSGSFTTQFPGYDSQGRNAIPAGSQKLTGQAVTKPVPTNDWWSKLLNTDHVNNLYNYPFAMETTTSGLGITHIPRGVIGDQISLRVGVDDLNSTQATVDDHTDWTVSIKWADSNNSFVATSGIGMPFVYLTKGTSDIAKVVVEAGSVTVVNEQIRVLNARNGADFVVYAPTGSSWIQNGNTYTSSLNGQNYWSVAMLPQATTDIAQKSNEYQKYAYVFPANTTANWSYNENTSVLRTDFTITTETKEGAYNQIIQGLLPHQWGEMVNHLVRDAASPNRNDSLFPFLRNFSPYAGHCWANGFAFFPQGNDQESTSESMQFNSSLIHWGTITGNDEIRDLGIYLYTTEQSAVEEYWFDINDRTFVDTQHYGLISRLWGNDYDNGTFWTADIAATYGIEFYPIHGGSLYLGHNTDYVESLWAYIEENTGILQNEENLNLWHDVYWQYLSFIDPLKAINLYDSSSNRSLKFGVSDAQTYHWIHNMHMLGRVNTGVSADYPIAAVFVQIENLKKLNNLN